MQTDGHWLTDFDVAHIRDELESQPNENGIGQRYYPADDLTQDERNRYDNLILLCKPHHKLIDSVAPMDYSVELLHEWKREAESDELRAILEATFGEKTLKEVGWAHALLDGTAIKSVHSASEEALQALNSRITVTSEYASGQTVFRLDAQEPAPTQWKFGGDTDQYAKLWEIKNLSTSIWHTTTTLRNSGLSDVIRNTATRNLPIHPLKLPPSRDSSLSSIYRLSSLWRLLPKA